MGGSHSYLYTEEQYQLNNGFKENPYTCESYPSLLRIPVLLLHTALAFSIFHTTAGQLSSATNITLPRYLKEFTILRGRP